MSIPALRSQSVESGGTNITVARAVVVDIPVVVDIVRVVTTVGCTEPRIVVAGTESAVESHSVYIDANRDKSKNTGYSLLL